MIKLNRDTKKTLFTLGFKMCFGDSSARCPADHLCAGFVTAYVTSAQRSNVRTRRIDDVFSRYKRYVVKRVPDRLGKRFE